jgi:hypothetical protein
MKIKLNSIKVLTAIALLSVFLVGCNSNTSSSLAKLCGYEKDEATVTDCQALEKFKNDSIAALAEAKPHYKKFLALKESGDKEKMKAFLIQHGEEFRKKTTPALYENKRFNYILDLGTENDEVIKESWKKQYGGRHLGDSEYPKNLKEPNAILGLSLSWGLRSDYQPRIQKLVDEYGMSESEAGNSVDLFAALVGINSIASLNLPGTLSQQNPYTKAIIEDFQQAFPVE